ncbi:MAG: phosphoenolpyruvate synthase [Chloroflexi bacterium]|nr:phosphoenolpyruvate synthase [Chloroflexota bacterium]
MDRLIRWFAEVGTNDLALAGGKGASLSELTRAGIPVPPGFILVAQAYFHFLKANDLTHLLESLLRELNPNDSTALNEASRRIKLAITSAPLPTEISAAIRKAYHALGKGLVAVRSSATAEDLSWASFAGQQSTFLNITGDKELLNAVRECWASLFEPRALFYRAEHGLDHMKVGIAVVIQRMVQSTLSGVLFTVEPMANDKSKMAIEAVYGLGEALVSGLVTPDYYLVDKKTLETVEKKIARQEWKIVGNPNSGGKSDSPNIRTQVLPPEQAEQKLSDTQIVALARLGRLVELHYGHPQDIEWAYEGGTFSIVQSRPITTLDIQRDSLAKINARVLLTGSGASPGMGAGKVRIVRDLANLYKVGQGDVLVAEATTPDFVPAMKRAAAIVTDQGGRTCHAAIVSRELGIPCVVGTEKATKVLVEEQMITVNGSEGTIYEGKLELAAESVHTETLAQTATRVYVNLADPERAGIIAQRHVDGVGLLRAEFIIAHIGEHPRYMLESGRGAEWSSKLADGIESFARSFHPRPVVYRLSDFKTNEYRNLRGGEKYEPHEENPMIGYRGASRYIHERDLFHLEADAILKVWRQYPNLYVMVPFVRTPEELAGVKQLLEEEGLRRRDGLKLWMMAEIPSNVILLDQFLNVGVDGISIGSNDLTQLVLGIDRDNAKFHETFDERNPAIMWCLERLIRHCDERGITSSICGQAPSFYPELTEKLVEWGITSFSVSPDMIDQTREIIARVEGELGKLPPQREE